MMLLLDLFLLPNLPLDIAQTMHKCFVPYSLQAVAATTGKGQETSETL